eukprot:TRINITY_DN24766_c0_g1_i2.p2 TRINITY_DN24766_c0_g1~~TRINITY_DN24766_c0_g1_i2.p2  ORF type:complete len:100 (-),score=4.37 TRINITY_DN24766_c0_g1_i2:170-469(-)
MAASLPSSGGQFGNATYDRKCLPQRIEKTRICSKMECNSAQATSNSTIRFLCSDSLAVTSRAKEHPRQHQPKSTSEADIGHPAFQCSQRRFKAKKYRTR